MTLLQRLTNEEYAVFEEIIECPRCLTKENLCDSHAQSIKEILLKDVKKEINRIENS